MTDRKSIVYSILKNDFGIKSSDVISIDIIPITAQVCISKNVAKEVEKRYGCRLPKLHKGCAINIVEQVGDKNE